jgi:hypothetical protein
MVILKTAEQVNSLHNLFKLLRKLRVIGLVDTKVVKESLSESGRGPSCYRVEILKIHSKAYESPEELLEKLFRDCSLL